jgi:hypothetical protein
MKTVLIFISGTGILVLFVAAIVMSLNKNASGFFKYFLAYLCFIAAIGLLFYLFGGAYIWIGLIAAGGWILLIIKGSGYSHIETEEAPEDSPS